METLNHYLDTLKLKSMKENYQKEADESLKKSDSYEQFLCRLSEQEVLSRGGPRCLDRLAAKLSYSRYMLRC